MTEDKFDELNQDISSLTEKIILFEKNKGKKLKEEIEEETQRIDSMAKIIGGSVERHAETLDKDIEAVLTGKIENRKLFKDIYTLKNELWLL